MCFSKRRVSRCRAPHARRALADSRDRQTTTWRPVFSTRVAPVFTLACISGKIVSFTRRRGGAVEVVSLEQKYWQKAFNGARRIVGGLPDLSLVVPSAEAAPPAAPTALPASSADNLKSRSSARPATDF